MLSPGWLAEIVHVPDPKNVTTPDISEHAEPLPVVTERVTGSEAVEIAATEYVEFTNGWDGTLVVNATD